MELVVCGRTPFLSSPWVLGDGSEEVLLAYLLPSGHERVNRYSGPCRCGSLITWEGIELEVGCRSALRVVGSLPLGIALKGRS